MVGTISRLRNLLREEPGECRDSDVEQRLDELHAIADAAFADDSARPIFAVLGNETRYRLARALTVAEDELCVCELEQLVGVSESAVSHALSDLVSAGIANRRKDGNWRYYTCTDLASELFATADRWVSDE